MPADTGTGRSGYFVAVLVAVAGVAGSIAFVMNFLSKLDTGEQFIAPGSHAFVVEKPGKHVVWNDYRTVFQGRSYDLPERLPDGMRIRVTESASGNSVEVSSSRGASSTTAEAERVSIASFEATTPGRHEITIEGGFAPRVFSVGPTILPQLFMTIVAAVSAMFFGIAGALALAVWTFLKRNPMLTVARPAAPAGAAPAPAAPAKVAPEESARQMAIVVYALQAAAFVVPLTLVAGIIVNYVKRDDTAGTWLESHFTWQIRTFWWWLVWALVGLALAIVVVGFLVWFADAVWLAYRVIKGGIRLSEGKPMYSES